jgi:hypothetical protein
MIGKGDAGGALKITLAGGACQNNAALNDMVAKSNSVNVGRSHMVAFLDERL